MLAIAAVAAGCSSEKEASEPMGNATPAASPQANKPAGQVIRIDRVHDVAAAGEKIAVRHDADLTVGTSQELQRGGGWKQHISHDCGDLSAANGKFVLACPHPVDGAGTGEVYVIDPQAPGLDNKRHADHPFQAATVTSDGTVVAGSPEDNKVVIFGSGGTKEVDLGRGTDQLVASGDMVAAMDRKTTAVTGIPWQEAKSGATLRAGAGVGQIAAGGEDVVLASDTTGNQLLLFTGDGVIRQHQARSTKPAGSPFAVAWDALKKRALVATTANNRITAYDPANGYPNEVAGYNSIADVNSLDVLGNGDIVAGGPAGVQIIPAH